MKKTRQPLLASAALILALTGALAGCTDSGSGGTGKNENGSKPVNASKAGNGSEAKPNSSDRWELGSEPLEFSLYGHYSWHDFPEWESKQIGKLVKELKNVSITSIAAAGNHEQLLATMMSSDDLTDVIWTDRDHRELERLRKAGKLVPLDGYLDKYPNLKTWIGEKELDLLRSEDGKLYQFPNWYTNKPTGTAGYVVNKKIYEELGSPKLETTDDLYAYLKQVKGKYGDDIVPLDVDRAVDIQGMGVLYSAFKENAIYFSFNDQMQGVVDGDKISSLLTDPTFRESQKYVAKLYREKLISQDAFTQTQDQVKEKLMNGKVAVYTGANVTKLADAAHQELTKKDPNAGYFMIWPIHKPGLDKNKIFTSHYFTVGWNVAAITTAAKDPEKIFAFLDWYTGPEGMTLQFFGPEGGNWQGFDENQMPIFTDKYDPANVAAWQAESEIFQFVGNSSYIDKVKVKLQDVLPDAKKSWVTKYQSEITWPTSYKATELTGLIPDPDSELGTISQSFGDLFDLAFAQSAMAKNDQEVDDILDKAEAEAEKFGYGKLLEYRTEQWKKNKATLGIE
ncbi:extracellular solute-binding protein [Paenibacillus aurantiacus]|uniref:Extracellular solute-binding protein n=1 Tax=Paenibacillus aurantiacus TaxID=1936118 RepID=A0ABV5KXH5_9BACL